MATITGSAGTVINATCTVSDDGQDIDETESAATAQSIVNDLATILEHAAVDTVVANSAGFANDANQGNFKFDGDVTIMAGASLEIASSGVLSVPAGATMTIATALATLGASSVITATAGAQIAGEIDLSGVAYISGRRRLAARVTLSDADHTVAYAAGSGVTDVGTRFQLPDSGALRTITLKSTTVVPGANEIYEFLFPGTVGGGTGTRWTFVREDASTIASFVVNGTGQGGTRNFMWAEFEYASSAWHLAGNSGMWVDVAGNADYGVVPGASM